MQDPFLRAALDQDSAERLKILGELRKDAGLERSAVRTAAAPDAELPQSGPKKADPERPAPPEPEKKLAAPAAPTPMEVMTKALTAFQQTVSSRVLVLDERDAQKIVLSAAVVQAEEKATVYAKALAEARQLVMQLYSTAVDLKKRVGRGELKGDSAPGGSRRPSNKT